MSTSHNSHYFSEDLNENDFQPQQQPQQPLPFLALPEQSSRTIEDEYDSMMEQRTTAMNTPDFGPLQANNLFYGRSSPSSPLLVQQQQYQHEQKEERTRLVLRLAILFERLHKMGQETDSSSAKNHHLLLRRAKQIVRYATQRNRLGDPRFSPLVESIEQCLADLVGCDAWFSICLEAEQRHRVRQISHTMMIVSSSMMLGSNNLTSSSSFQSATGSPFKPSSSNFSSSFFP